MFALQARDVPRMRSYEEAKRTHDRIKEARDGNKYLSRNKALEMFEAGGVFFCNYNSNTCVTYYADNTAQLHDCGWITPSTCTFITACTGIQCFTHKKEKIYAYLNGGYFLVNGGLRVDLATMKPIDPTQEERTVLDRKAAKEIYAKFKPTFDQLLAIAPAIEQSEDVARAFRANLPLSAQYNDPDPALSGRMDDKELVTNWILWQSALPVVDAPFGRKRYHVEPRSSAGGTQGHMRQVITRLMKYVYRKEGCTKTELVPLGEIAKDNY